MDDHTQDDLIAPPRRSRRFYIQLHENGHPNEDLLAVQNAYRIAVQMFGGHFRANEKPFVCHLVGTASAVAQSDNRIDLILAGLLHAAFNLGQFPDGKFGGHTDAHRQWLASKVGAEVATLAARYDKFKFLPTRREACFQLHARPRTRHRKVRLCNEIDDLADGGLTFATKHGESISPHAANCAILAERIGEPQIAKTLVALASQSDAMTWTAFLRPAVPHGYQTIPNLLAYARLRNRHRRGKNVKLL